MYPSGDEMSFSKHSGSFGHILKSEDPQFCFPYDWFNLFLLFDSTCQKKFWNNCAYADKVHAKQTILDQEFQFTHFGEKNKYHWMCH